ncbi:MAG: Panacea domain-containing protein [Thermodesulfobacteriota bacterium]
MIITHYREKLINAAVYFAKNTKFCGKTKLMKLLFFLDFMHFKQTGKSVTGLTYYTWERGPVPKVFFRELDSMKPDLSSAIRIVKKQTLEQIVPKRQFDDTHFTRRELRLLETLAEVYLETKADDMVEVAHLPNEPWDKTLREKGVDKEIDYLLAIDNSSDSLPFEEAKQRMEDIAEMRKVFGVA